MGGLEVLISFFLLLFVVVSYKKWGAEGGGERSVTKTSTHTQFSYGL